MSWREVLLFSDSFTVEVKSPPEVVHQRLRHRIIEPKLFRARNPDGARFVGHLSEVDFDMWPLPEGPLAIDDSKPAVYVVGQLEATDVGTVVRVRLNLGMHMKLFFWLLYFIGLATPLVAIFDPPRNDEMPVSIAALFISGFLMVVVPAMWAVTDLRRVRSNVKKTITDA